MKEIIIQYLPSILTALISYIAAVVVKKLKSDLLDIENKKDSKLKELQTKFQYLSTNFDGMKDINANMIDNFNGIKESSDDVKSQLHQLYSTIEAQNEQIKELTEKLDKVHQDNIIIKSEITKEDKE